MYQNNILDIRTQLIKYLHQNNISGVCDWLLNLFNEKEHQNTQVDNLIKVMIVVKISLPLHFNDEIENLFNKFSEQITLKDDFITEKIQENSNSFISIQKKSFKFLEKQYFDSDIHDLFKDKIFFQIEIGESKPTRDIPHKLISLFSVFDPENEFFYYLILKLKENLK